MPHRTQTVGGVSAAIYHRRRINICCHLRQCIFRIQDMKSRCCTITWVLTNPTSNSKKNPLWRWSSRLILHVSEVMLGSFCTHSVITVPDEVEMSSCSRASIKSDLRWIKYVSPVQKCLVILPCCVCMHGRGVEWYRNRGSNENSLPKTVTD